MFFHPGNIYVINPVENQNKEGMQVTHIGLISYRGIGIFMARSKSVLSKHFGADSMCCLRSMKKI